MLFPLQTEFSEPWDSSRWEHLLPVANKEQNQAHLKPVNRNKSFSERLDPLLGKMDEHFISMIFYFLFLILKMYFEHYILFRSYPF